MMGHGSRGFGCRKQNGLLTTPLTPNPSRTLEAQYSLLCLPDRHQTAQERRHTCPAGLASRTVLEASHIISMPSSLHSHESLPPTSDRRAYSSPACMEYHHAVLHLLLSFSISLMQGSICWTLEPRRLPCVSPATIDVF
jgi:hypothetical protein